MRLLIIEDEERIIRFLSKGLTEEGFAVDSADDGNKGLEFALTNDYDLLIIDWMLPSLSGIEICTQLRKREIGVPVIFLTAKDTEADVIFALDSGANDYIKKPFSFNELLARIRVQLRKSAGEQTVLHIGSLSVDVESHKASVNSEELDLTKKEFALLEYLLRNKGKVCTRTNIIEHVWDIHFDYNSTVIDVYINYLRSKIRAKKGGEYIHTIRGVGYIAKEE